MFVNDSGIVRILLRDPRVDSCAHNSAALVRACMRGYFAIMKLLVSADDRDIVDIETAFIAACENNHVEIVEFFIRELRINNNEHGIAGTALSVACKNGHIKIVEIILNKLYVDPTINNNDPIIQAYGSGNQAVIDLLMQPSPRAYSVPNVYAQNYRAIHLTCENHHSGLFKDLIHNLRDQLPSKHIHTLIARASNRGYLDILIFLVERFPGCSLDRALIAGCKFGHFKIVEYLLGLGVDPAVGGNLPIIIACTSGYVDIVKKLLSYPEVDPGDDDNEAFICACMYGKLPVVQLLCEPVDDRIDPGARHCGAFIGACRNDHPDVVKYLLTIPEAYNSAAIDAGLLFAKQNGNTEVVQILCAQFGLE